MAVKPAETAYTEEELALIERIEAWVDDELKLFAPPGTVRTVLECDEFLPGGVDINTQEGDKQALIIGLRLLPEVILRFRKAGWRVSHNEAYDHQHELTFTPK